MGVEGGQGKASRVSLGPPYVSQNISTTISVASDIVIIASNTTAVASINSFS